MSVFIVGFGGGVKKALAVTVFCMATCALSAPCAAGVRFELTYGYTEVEVLPSTGICNYSYDLIYELGKNNNVSFYDGQKNFHRIHLGSNGAFASEVREEGNIEFRVSGGGLSVTRRRPGWTRIERIVPNGPNACVATIEYFKIPGHKYFEEPNNRTGEILYFSDEHVENLTCRASETKD